MANRVASPKAKITRGKTKHKEKGMDFQKPSCRRLEMALAQGSAAAVSQQAEGGTAFV